MLLSSTVPWEKLACQYWSAVLDTAHIITAIDFEPNSKQNNLLPLSLAALLTPRLGRGTEPDFPPVSLKDARYGPYYHLS
jgi:hypothetical protein